MLSSLLLPQFTAASCSSSFIGRTLHDDCQSCAVFISVSRKAHPLTLAVKSSWQNEDEQTKVKTNQRKAKSGTSQDVTSAQSTVTPEKMMTSAVTLLAAGMLLLLPAGDAMAAKSGGRVGGSTFRSSPPSSRSSTRPPPQVNRSRTNVYINPPVVAPPVFGYGPAPIFGGWTPFYSYGPSVVIGGGWGGGGIFSLLFFFLITGVVFNVVRGLFRRRDDDDYY